MSNRSKAKQNRKGRQKQQEQKKQQQKAQQVKKDQAQPKAQEQPNIRAQPTQTGTAQVQTDQGQMQQATPRQPAAQPQRGQVGAAQENKKRKNRGIIGGIIILIILLLCLFLRSCRARDEPAETKPDTADIERVYEEDRHAEYPVIVPDTANKRLNLALSDNYVISEDSPFFYIGFPKENIYDVIFTLKGGEGQALYRTGYVAPGTNVAIDGTGFLDRGEQKIDCLVSVYDHESGTLISDCTTVVLNIKFE